MKNRRLELATEVELINDFVANGYGCLCLEPADVCTIQEGTPVRRLKTKHCLGFRMPSVTAGILRYTPDARKLRTPGIKFNLLGVEYNEAAPRYSFLFNILGCFKEELGTFWAKQTFLSAPSEIA